MADEMMTLTEFAKAIGKSRRTVMRMLASGALTSDVKLPGKTGAHLFKVDRTQKSADPPGSQAA
jgi:hypothetical protein